MGRKILIGIGESGCNIIEKFAERSRQTDENVFCLAVDTDERSLEKIVCAKTIPVVSDKRLGDIVSEEELIAVQYFLPLSAEIFNGKFIKSLEMNKGAGLWRAKALFALWAHLSYEDKREEFFSTLDNAFDFDNADEEKELYVVASLSGGTGSGLFLPFTFLVERYFKQKTGKPVSAKLCLISAEVYQNKLTAEQGVKANANAYAAMQELNAVYSSVKSDGGE